MTLEEAHMAAIQKVSARRVLERVELEGVGKGDQPVFYRLVLSRLPAGAGYTLAKESGAGDKVLNRTAWHFDDLTQARRRMEKIRDEKISPERKSPRRYWLAGSTSRHASRTGPTAQRPSVTR